MELLQPSRVHGGREGVPIALFVLEALDCRGILLDGLSCRRLIKLRLNQRVHKPRLRNFRNRWQRHANGRPGAGADRRVRRKGEGRRAKPNETLRELGEDTGEA